MVDKGFCSNVCLCRADVKAIINEMESEKRRYTTKDGSWLVGSLISGEVKRDGQRGSCFWKCSLDMLGQSVKTLLFILPYSKAGAMF